MKSRRDFYLFLNFTLSLVLAWVSINGARIHGHITALAGVAGAAQTGVLSGPGLVLTHGSVGAGVGVAAGELLDTLESRVAGGALTSEALGVVDAGAAVVARVGGALVHVDLAAVSREPGRAEALGPVVDSHTEATVLADALGAGHVLALVLGAGSDRSRLLGRVTLKALALTRQGLEEIDGTGGTGSKTGLRVGSGGALGAALVIRLCPRLECEVLVVTFHASLKDKKSEYE